MRFTTKLFLFFIIISWFMIFSGTTNSKKLHNKNTPIKKYNLKQELKTDMSDLAKHKDQLIPMIINNCCKIL